MADINQPFDVRRDHVYAAIRYALREAERMGMVVRIENEPQQPLAMTNHRHVVHIDERRPSTPETHQAKLAHRDGKEFEERAWMRNSPA